MASVGSQNGKRTIFSQTAPTEARDKILWVPLDGSNNPIDGLLNWWNGSSWVKFSSGGSAGIFTAVTVSGKLQANLLQPDSYTTGTLPSASANPRTIAFDSTLSRMVVSNGTIWEAIAPTRPSVAITSTRNLTTSDAQSQLYNASATAYTLTIPPSTFVADTEIEIACDSTGTLTIACGSGVTINGASTSVVCAAGKGGYLKWRSINVARWYGGS